MAMNDIIMRMYFRKLEEGMSGVWGRKGTVRGRSLDEVSVRVGDDERFVSLFFHVTQTH